MRYLLSIHDVWPGNVSLVEDHWRRLRSLGMGSAALLVVPEYHGARSIHADREFLAWLESKRAEGSEILLHGFRHRMAEAVSGASLTRRRSTWGRWVNARENREAEFCGLARADRESLLARGAEAFALAGLPLSGFVAPTWHGAPPRRALEAAGFGLWETRVRLQDLHSGKARFAPPLAWTKAGNGAVLFGGNAWLNVARKLPLIKVAIHPGDMESEGIFAELETIRSAGMPIPYAAVFEKKAAPVSSRGNIPVT